MNSNNQSLTKSLGISHTGIMSISLDGFKAVAKGIESLERAEEAAKPTRKTIKLNVSEAFLALSRGYELINQVQEASGHEALKRTTQPVRL
jgi:hypothetical protein